MIEEVKNSDLDAGIKIEAIRGYMQNRETLTKSLGELNFMYGNNSARHAEYILIQIARIDELVGNIISNKTTINK